MATTTLNARLCLKRDSYNNWEAVKETFVPLNGEACVIVVPASAGAVVQEPAILMKVGDGTKAIKDLPYVSAVAADVYDWAKAATKPSYTASEISGLADYISGEIQDTNTTYKIALDDTDDHKLILYKHDVTDEADVWTSAFTVTLPDDSYDDTALTALVNGKVASVSATDDSITIGGTATAPTVGVHISGVANNALVLDTTDGQKGLKVVLPDAAEYTIVKSATAETGYLATYELQKDGTKVGASINIPKDFLVKSGTVETVTSAQAGTTGYPAAAGTYIKLVLNTKDASGTDEPLWIDVGGLIEYVTSGSAAGDMVVITVDADTHKVTATITDGTVTKAKLHTDVQTSLGKADTAIQSVKVNGTALTPDGNYAVDVTVPTGALASKDEVAKSDLASALQDEIDGKADAGDLADIATSGLATDLSLNSGDYLIFDCGTASTVV